MYQKSPSSLMKHLDFILLDLFSLLVSFWLAIGIRLHIWIPSHIDTNCLTAAITISLIHICLAVFGREYQSILRRSGMEEFRAALRHVLTVMGILLICMFFAKRFAVLSRLLVVYTAVLSLILLSYLRMLRKFFLRRRLAKNPRILLVISDERGAERILMKFGSRPIDFRVSGIVLLEREGALEHNPDQILDVPVVAHINTLLPYLAVHPVDELLFCLPPDDRTVTQDLIQRCCLCGLAVHLELTAPVDLGPNEFQENLAGVPVLTSYLKLVTISQAALKRFMDIAGALIGLAFTAVLCLFVAPGIYLIDGRPIFFAQNRVGKNGRSFKMYKFRSMYRDAEADKRKLAETYNINMQMFKMDDDPRILGSGADGTRHGFGYFIRRTSIDEFPQFWNVLKGDMSLVGTRPPTVDEYLEYEARHRARLAIKPGITGLWQVSGRSDITDFEEVVKLDVEYIRDWSIWLDIRILAKTVEVVISRKGSK